MSVCNKSQYCLPDVSAAVCVSVRESVILFVYTGGEAPLFDCVFDIVNFAPADESEYLSLIVAIYDIAFVFKFVSNS